jgi:hypothetical protein
MQIARPPKGSFPPPPSYNAASVPLVPPPYPGGGPAAPPPYQQTDPMLQGPPLAPIVPHEQYLVASPMPMSPDATLFLTTGPTAAPSQQQPLLVSMKNPTTGEDETFVVMPPPQPAVAAPAAASGSYKLLVRKEKKALFDALTEKSMTVHQMPNGLLTACVVVQCPSDLLTPQDVSEVIDNFIKSASATTSQLHHVPIIGIKPARPTQIEWLVTIEGLPVQSRDAALAAGRLKMADGNRADGAQMVMLSTAQLQQLLSAAARGSGM